MRPCELSAPTVVSVMAHATEIDRIERGPGLIVIAGIHAIAALSIALPIALDESLGAVEWRAGAAVVPHVASDDADAAARLRATRAWARLVAMKGWRR